MTLAMRKVAVLCSALWVCVAWAKVASAQELVSRQFPGHPEITILSWTVPAEELGYVSQIVVLRTAGPGAPVRLWQSSPDLSYGPKVSFLSEIAPHGVPLALVQRQTGAAAAELDVIGQANGRFGRLLQIDGFRFEVQRIGRDRMWSIVAHTDASLLDVPQIYSWSGSHFIDDSAGHPAYSRPEIAPARHRPAVLLRLSRIAVLAGDSDAARKILEGALATRTEPRQGCRPRRRAIDHACFVGTATAQPIAPYQHLGRRGRTPGLNALLWPTLRLFPVVAGR